MSITKKSLLVTGAVLVAGYLTWVGVYNWQHRDKPVEAPETAQTTHPVASELFTLVNDERVKNGLQPLVEDPRLDASAAAKCNDLVALNYWSHERPDGTPEWHFFHEQGINYVLAAENQAYGQRTSQEVVTSWMNSSGHKKNIINPNYNHVGYAVCHSDNFIDTGPEDVIVQHFTN